MKKIAPIRFRFTYMDLPDSQRRITIAYDRIFELARKRLALESSSTSEYTDNNGAKRGIFDTRGSSRKVESEEDYHLSDVSDEQDSSCEVWESLADKQQVTYGIIPRKGD